MSRLQHPFIDPLTKPLIFNPIGSAGETVQPVPLLEILKFVEVARFDDQGMTTVPTIDLHSQVNSTDELHPLIVEADDAPSKNSIPLWPTYNHLILNKYASCLLGTN